MLIYIDNNIWEWIIHVLNFAWVWGEVARYKQTNLDNTQQFWTSNEFFVIQSCGASTSSNTSQQVWVCAHNFSNRSRATSSSLYNCNLQLSYQPAYDTAFVIMIVTPCAAKHLCGMQGSPIQMKGIGNEPQHYCINCDKAMHSGGNCGLQWVDTNEMGKLCLVCHSICVVWYY